MKHRLLLIAMILSAGVNAQQGFKRTQNKMLDEAEVLMQAQEYSEAAKIYRRLVPVDTGFAEASYNLGLCEWNLPGRWESSAPHFARAARSGHTEAHYMLALCRHRQQRFDEALDLFTRYKQLFYRMVDDAEVDRHMAMANTAKALTRMPSDLRIVNLGPYVNTKAHDYAPLVTADRSKMYFTSRREGTTGDLRDQNGQWFEDIWTSNQQNGVWMQAQNAGQPLNTPIMDATVGMSPSGDTLLIYRSDADLNGGDLYMAHRNSTGWTQPEMLTEHVNSGSHEP
ncbi:MAG: tetratricopeptide repeat protein, partial [Flavobacteriales bacterium]